MTDWRVPLADVAIDEAEIQAVAETYRSGWLSIGPKTQELEEALCDYTGAPNAIAVANCTAALHLSCMATGLGSGDEVISPSLTFVATANSIRYTGADVVFADVCSLERPWLDAADVAAKITPRTRAIMAMSYGGSPGEIAELAELAAEHDLILLEDAAHGLGSSLDGRSVGTFGSAGSFSFFSNKNLPVGEGGAIVTGDDGLAERLRLLRSHGMTSLSWDRHRGHSFGYDVVKLGFNYRIDEPRATLANARLGGLDGLNEQRRQLAEAYREALASVDGVTPALPPQDGAVTAQHLFTVVVDEGVDRDAVRSSMAEARVQTSLHYPPVHLFSIYRDESVSLPVTEQYAGRSISLPMFPHMSEEQLGIVVESVEAGIQTGRG